MKGERGEDGDDGPKGEKGVRGVVGPRVSTFSKYLVIALSLRGTDVFFCKWSIKSVFHIFQKQISPSDI